MVLFRAYRGERFMGEMVAFFGGFVVLVFVSIFRFGFGFLVSRVVYIEGFRAGVGLE